MTIPFAKLSFSTLLYLLWPTVTFFGLTYANRNCEKIYDQAVEEKAMKLAYKAAILRCISYFYYYHSAIIGHILT
jgi:hypothetical protein